MNAKNLKDWFELSGYCMYLKGPKNNQKIYSIRGNYIYLLNVKILINDEMKFIDGAGNRLN